MVPSAQLRIFLLFGLLVPACATPVALAPIPALDAPSPSPPGDWPAQERLAWWEKMVDRLSPADAAEARLCMGSINLELKNGRLARNYFRMALENDLSIKEASQARLGIAKAWLLEGQVELALPYLEDAIPHLAGPPLEEGRYLVAWASGKEITGPVESSIVARLSPFMSGLRPVSAFHSPTLGMKVDVARASWTPLNMRGNHETMARPFRITIHHSAEPLHGTRMSDSLRKVRNIQKAHRDKGWAGIGYHFLIDRGGRVIEGRPLAIQGAHAGDSEMNRGNIGICLLGNFQTQPDRGSAYIQPQSPSSFQLAALKGLLDRLRKQFSIQGKSVFAHLELKGTLCPGPELDAWVRFYRSRS